MRRMYSLNQLEEQSIELLGSGKVPSIKGDEIIENMEGYSVDITSSAGWTTTPIYYGVVKNGNKLTLVAFGKVKKTDESATSYPSLGKFTVPQDLLSKIVPSSIGGIDNCVDIKAIQYIASGSFASPISKQAYCVVADGKLALSTYFNTAVVDTEYSFRYEFTILLSENLAE